MTGLTGAAGDAGLHRKQDTFTVLSDRAQQRAAELSIFPTTVASKLSRIEQGLDVNRENAQRIQPIPQSNQLLKSAVKHQHYKP